MGLQLFIGMRPKAARNWSERIYNADDGKSYVSNVTLEDAARLKVQGCVGGFCGGEIWSRSKR